VRWAVVVCLVGAGAAAARADDRTVFEYKSGVFVHLTGDKWVEKRDGDVDSKFQELERTNNYVELYDADRKLKVRLYGNRGEAFNKDTQKWSRWPGSEGKWRAK
jgi:hypothetical protein